MNRGSYTTFEKLIGLFTAVKVRASDDKRALIVESPLGEGRIVEVEPLVFREVDGQETTVFHTDDRGAVTHMFLSNVPMMGMEKLAWYQNPSFHMTLSVISLLVFLLVVIGASVRFIRNRRGGTRVPQPREVRLARSFAVGVALLNILFVFALGILASNFQSIATGETSMLRFVLTIPMLAAIFAIGVTGFAVLAWQKKLWNVWGRVRYTAVAAAALAFLWVTNYWNLLGWKF